MATAIENTEIEALAKGIGINPKLDKLGLNLGYEYSAIDVFKANNYSGGRVTCEGTKEMLKDWRNETPEDQQRPILKKALGEAGLVRLAERHLRGTATGEAAMASEQAERSETHSGQPSRTQAQNGVTNTINASESSTVSGNTMIGQQKNFYNSAPSAPAVHHHNTTVVHQAPPVMPVSYIPRMQAPKRQANPIAGPAPKRQKVSQGRPSTSKVKSSKPKKSSTTKSSGNKVHTTKKPATPKTSKKKAPKTQKAPKPPKKKAPKTADTKKKSPKKKPKVTKQKPPKTKQPKTQKSKNSGRVRPQKKPKKSKRK